MCVKILVSVNNDVYEVGQKVIDKINKSYEMPKRKGKVIIPKNYQEFHRKRHEKLCDFIREHGKKILELEQMFRDD